MSWVPRKLLVIIALAATAVTAGAQSHKAKTVVVTMIDKTATTYAFEPANVTVQPGDTLRFVQTGTMPHNVAFKAAPTDAALGGALVGPFLTAKDQTYDLVIDGRFPTGEYTFNCTPHETLGMKGTMTVGKTVSKAGKE